MHTVFALLCFVVVIHWLIFPYPSGLLHWHCGNLTIAPVPAKQPWWIWINTSCEFIMNDRITTTKQSTTKPCAYFLWYTVPRDCWLFDISCYLATASVNSIHHRRFLTLYDFATPYTVATSANKKRLVAYRLETYPRQSATYQIILNLGINIVMINLRRNIISFHSCCLKPRCAKVILTITMKYYNLGHLV